jgi:purine-binding chemotaxis protein CheW
MASSAERYVTFRVADETYAVPAANVREVTRWMPATRVPHGARAMKGVINLRGEVVVVLDLRVLLNLPPVEPTDRTCIVVVWAEHQGRRLQTGLIVDTALEVARIGPHDLETISGAAPTLSGDYVAAVARTKDGLTLLLDVERLALDGLSPAAIPA